MNDSTHPESVEQNPQNIASRSDDETENALHAESDTTEAQNERWINEGGQLPSKS